MHRNWFGTLIIELLKSSNKQVRKTCHERDCCQGSWPYQIPNNGLVKTWYNWGSWYHFWKCQFIGKAAISIIMIYEMFVEGPSEVVGLFICVCEDTSQPSQVICWQCWKCFHRKKFTKPAILYQFHFTKANFYWRFMFSFLPSLDEEKKSLQVPFISSRPLNRIEEIAFGPKKI